VISVSSVISVFLKIQRVAGGPLTLDCDALDSACNETTNCCRWMTLGVGRREPSEQGAWQMVHGKPVPPFSYTSSEWLQCGFLEPTRSCCHYDHRPDEFESSTPPSEKTNPAKLQNPTILLDFFDWQHYKYYKIKTTLCQKIVLLGVKCDTIYKIRSLSQKGGQNSLSHLLL